jgi:hypothetical protein
MRSAQKSQHSQIQCLDDVQPRRLILAGGLMKAARMDPLIEKVAELDGSEFCRYCAFILSFVSRSRGS